MAGLRPRVIYGRLALVHRRMQDCLFIVKCLLRRFWWNCYLCGTLASRHRPVWSIVQSLEQSISPSSVEFENGGIRGPGLPKCAVDVRLN